MKALWLDFHYIKCPRKDDQLAYFKSWALECSGIYFPFNGFLQPLSRRSKRVSFVAPGRLDFLDSFWQIYFEAKVSSPPPHPQAYEFPSGCVLKGYKAYGVYQMRTE